MSELKHVTVYCDGACSPNPGVGGWGAVLIYGPHKKQLNGKVEVATNNQMELLAAIESLKALTQPCDVTIYTDSQYVKNGIMSWIAGWKRNGWKTANKQPVKNQELWIELDRLKSIHDVQFRWVKGHNGHPLNEEVDQLAVRGRMGDLV